MAKEFYAPSYQGGHCEFCSQTTYWKLYDKEDGWVAACKFGEGCAKDVRSSDVVNLADLSKIAGVSLAVTMRRVESGVERSEIIGATHLRLPSGAKTPVAEIRGVTKTLAEWARIYKIKYQTIRKRHLKGWTGKDLIEKPGSTPRRRSAG